MPEPLSATGGTLTLSGVAWLSYFYGLPAEVVLGAFTGAVIFITAAQEYPIKKRLVLTLVSFIAGILLYRPAASMVIAIMTNWTGVSPGTVETNSAYAGSALITSVVAVRLLMYLYGRSADPQALLKRGSDDGKL